jgi:hypothetical protein
VWEQPQPSGLYPVAGYSIWWDGLSDWPDAQYLSQTTVAWSYFPGHAHKHADELSVLLWAGGENWWTSAGYWPYGDDRWRDATSWDGSNGPHVVGEPPESNRNTRLLGHGRTDRLSVIDLERSGPDAFSARRQVVRLQPNIWLVLDRMSGAGPYRTTWSSSSTLVMEPGEVEGTYVVVGSKTGRTLNVFPSGSDGVEFSLARGSRLPFAGWEMVNGEPQPAPALIVEQPGPEAWTAVAWQLDGGSEAFKLKGAPRVSLGKDATQWSVYLPVEQNEIEIRRDGDSVSVSSAVDSGNMAPVRVSLSVQSGIDERVAEIRNNFTAAAKKYPPLVPVGYRTKMTWGLLLGFAIQELLVGRFLRQERVRRPLGRVVLGAWGAVAIVVVFSFNQIIDVLVRII